MDYPLSIDRIRMELFILYFMGCPVKISINRGYSNFGNEYAIYFIE